MKRIFENFLLMLQLMTRIPLNMNLPCEVSDFKRGGYFFSLVGLVIGMIQYGVFLLFDGSFDYNVLVIFIIIIEVFITGGFHIDGLGDTCDGFFAFKGKDKIIDIMKDSRIGTFACIGICLSFMIKYVGYEYIISLYGGASIIFIPMISRAGISLISYIGKPAKENGTGNLFINTMGISQVIFNSFVTVIVGYLIFGGVKTLMVFLLSLIIVILFNGYCNRKINGITGDSLGATNEIVMMVVLIFLSGTF
ncbi:MAG: adenosylcobinamide-GDP ribazoletransferase [Clostridium sp.]